MDFGWIECRHNSSRVNSSNANQHKKKTSPTRQDEHDDRDLGFEESLTTFSNKGLFRDSHYLASDDDSSESASESNEDYDAAAESDGTMKMNENDLKKLSKEQLKNKLKKLGLKVSGNKGELIDRLLNPSMHKKRPDDWKKSKAKALLHKLFQDRESRLYKMTPRQIYDSHKWYQEYPYHRFKENVTSLRKSIEENFARVDRDVKIVREELQNFPQCSEGCRGYPRWDKHSAKSLLRQDIEEGKYKLGDAKRFQQSRAEYCEFPLTVFRDHIHQERRRQREKPMKVIQRNRKAQKAHQNEVDESEALWLADEKYEKEVDDMISAMENF
mmetsp:Transcript_362/g.449  ORF Transcript_362/g.449 Transcript_362/m.449 type:complete len:328 (-) Transcript_362:72-1055(-)